MDSNKYENIDFGKIPDSNRIIAMVCTIITSKQKVASSDLQFATKHSRAHITRLLAKARKELGVDIVWSKEQRTYIIQSWGILNQELIVNICTKYHEEQKLIGNTRDIHNSKEQQYA